MINPQNRDFGTLATNQIALAGLADVQSASGEDEAAEALASLVLEIFRDYYGRKHSIPWLAKKAFENRDWAGAIALSQERLAIYSLAIAETASTLQFLVRAPERSADFWRRVEGHYGALVTDLYEADLALAFLASIRRAVYRNVWTPVGYRPGRRPGDVASSDFLLRLKADGLMTPELIKTVLAVPEIAAPFRDLDRDALDVADRINDELGLTDDPTLAEVEMLRAGFFRNRGAYVVGALTFGETRVPLSLALLHGEDGVYVDAVILRETTLRHIFSSTLANFHVTMTRYHELVDYLFGLMPTRPHGLHYSTVGYNHIGKLAVMEQITSVGDGHDEPLDHAPGPRGSVAIGFTSPSRGYVMKVIRDKPTENYKWDRFDGVDAVLGKYHRVHTLNRAGSMLDNIIYSKVPLDRSLFDERFLDELMTEAPGSVSLDRGEVLFSHLIVQRKLTPVPLYLDSCTPEAAEMVVIRLGQCIRNNAATNVFNKDLDGRNYGVSTLRFVSLFDYDAIEPLTEVKVRTNADREAGEEDVPDWFFEEGDIFLPEELEMHLRLPERRLKRLFREAHGELLTAAYWQRMQERLSAGSVPRVRTYPRSTQLRL